jgi:hypothetical protein
MSRARPVFVRVLVVKQDGQWLAQGLEYDLNAQAPSEEQAFQSFVRQLLARVKRDVQLGRAPLHGVPEAPERFLDLWEEREDDHLSVEPVSDPESSVPPAYVIHGITKSVADSNLPH